MEIANLKIKKKRRSNGKIKIKVETGKFPLTINNHIVNERGKDGEWLAKRIYSKARHDDSFAFHANDSEPTKEVGGSVKWALRHATPARLEWRLKLNNLVG